MLDFVEKFFGFLENILIFVEKGCFLTIYCRTQSGYNHYFSLVQMFALKARVKLGMMLTV